MCFILENSYFTIISNIFIKILTQIDGSEYDELGVCNELIRTAGEMMVRGHPMASPVG